MRDSAATVGVEIDDELLDEILLEIYNEEVDEVSGISPTLYTANRDYFHKAIDDGIINSANAAIDLETSWIDALKHSADVFSLHRTANQCALLAESMIDADGNLKSFEQFKKDTQAINNHYNKAWLRTEYDTAVLRTQMGADWMMFMKDADVLPNLRWMQTTSANPREEHREFWANNLTLPIDDPFWDKHRPGDQWNCKCWLEQTDAPRTALEDMPDSADFPEPKAGLRGNTAKTKEIFSQDHPHFPHSCATCHLNTDGKVHGIKGNNKVKNSKTIIIGNCNGCKISDNCLSRINGNESSKKDDRNSKEVIQERKEKKLTLERSGLYKDIEFNETNGGLKATHVKHNLDDDKGWYEEFVRDSGFKHGYEVILGEEIHTIMNRRNTEGTWNGLPFEIAGAENGTDTNIRNALKHCAKKPGSRVAVIFFPKGYEKCNFYKGYARFQGLQKNNDGQFKQFDAIYLIDMNGDLTKIKP